MTVTNRSFLRLNARLGAAALALTAVAACEGPVDLDLRGRLGGPVDTASAAANATAPKPKPDVNGVISYPSYQVAVARRGDTLSTLADRVGADVNELARFNGIKEFDPLRAGEIVALPTRVEAQDTAPIKHAVNIDITTLAGNAFDQAAPTPGQTTAATTSGVEPIRHQVQRGETAFTIARLYNVTPRALADWNSLDRNYSIREGQYLLIPVTYAAEERVIEPATTTPGTGSPTPTPPSASKPLPPADTTAAATKPAETTTAAKPAEPVADVGTTTTASSASRPMQIPVQGSIIRDYAKGKNDGIDIAAPAGTAVKAAESGTVAAITTNTEGVPILVIKHSNNLLTVYTHIDGITVKKGDTVKRGETIGKVRAGDPARMHFEVRDGFDSVDPNDYI